MSNTADTLKGLDDALRENGHDVKGSDSAGGKYQSIREMWMSQGVLSTGTSPEWYERGTTYYEENCPETVDGVLGGFASITSIDLEGSRKYLDNLLQKRPLLRWADGAAAECGAGIGRVSKGLLLPLQVKRCDLVESSEGLLMAAPDYIGDPDVSKCRFFFEGLQNWEPRKNDYTVIWIQWVLCYLVDYDVVEFLKRCGEGLTEHGVIVLKENSCEDDMFVLDKDDASVTRSLPYLMKLVEAAGLRVVHQEFQEGFPEELFTVPIIALGVDRSK